MRAMFSTSSCAFWPMMAVNCSASARRVVNHFPFQVLESLNRRFPHFFPPARTGDAGDGQKDGLVARLLRGCGGSGFWPEAIDGETMTIPTERMQRRKSIPPQK